MFVRPKFLVGTSTVTWRAWPPGLGPCGSKRRHPCRLRFRSSTSLTPMTHFAFHPQQNPFASPPSRQRKVCFFCHPVGGFLLLSPAEVDDSGSRDGRHSPRANIPWEGAGKRGMAKLVFAVAEVGRTLFFPFFFHCAHAPVGDSRQRCVLRSRFSMLLPACSSASHVRRNPKSLHAEMPTGLHRCHDPLDMTERHDCASIRLASLSCPITLSRRPVTKGRREGEKAEMCDSTRL